MMGKDSFSPLMSILSENKLTGPNYVDWKRNLDIVLTAREYKYVLIDFCPVINANSTDDQLGAEIDAESHPNMILETLPDSFNQFKLNTSKLNMTLSEIQATEAIMKPKAQAHFFQSSSHLTPKGKKMKKEKNKRKG